MIDGLKLSFKIDPVWTVSPACEIVTNLYDYVNEGTQSMQLSGEAERA
jgi:hypothetical protein